MKRKRAPVSRWRSITAETLILVEDGQPVRARSRARNLDRAFDDVCQDFGRPLDCGSWEPAEEQANEGEIARQRERDGFGLAEDAEPVWWEITISIPDDNATEDDA